MPLINNYPLALSFSVPRRGPARGRFTMIEILTVIAILTLLFAMLFPSLAKAKTRAKYIRWLTYTVSLRNDPDLLAQYMFEEQRFIPYGATGNDSLSNTSYGVNEKNYAPRKLDGQIIGCAKTLNGRWKGKGAAYFPGNDSCYIQVNDTKTFNPDKNSFTVYLWFKPTANKGTAFLIVKGNDTPNSPAWSVFHKKSIYPRAAADDKQMYDDSKNAPTVVVNKWAFVALVIDRENKLASGYYNGERIFSLAITPKPGGGKKPPTEVSFNAAETFTVIGRGLKKNQPFKGYIDEIEIFRRALTSREIKNAYESGLP